MAKIIEIEQITLLNDRVRAEVRVASSCTHTTASLLEQACKHWPQLLEHTCANKVGPRFGDVAFSTSVPHLLEHIMIEHQARAARKKAATSKGASAEDLPTFLGSTHWLEGGHKRAQIEVSYRSDIDALEALRSGVDFLNSCKAEWFSSN